MNNYADSSNRAASGKNNQLTSTQEYSLDTFLYSSEYSKFFKVFKMFQSKKRILYLLPFLLLAGCGGKSDTSIEYHPMEERIPYWDSDIQTQIVQKESKDSTAIHFIDQEINFPPSITETFDLSIPQSVDLPLTSEENVLFRSIDTDRIVLLDVFQQDLYEYKLSTNSWELIAESGLGPGDLSNVQDIVIKNDTLYAVSQNSRIDWFDCHEKLCQYASTINLGESIQPVSLDITEEEFITIGSRASTGEGTTTDIKSQSLFAFDSAGELKRSGGKLYETNGHWMLLQPYARGKVRSVADSGELIQFFEHFPLVYHFNSNYELIKKIKFNEFTLAKQRYQPDTGELWIPQEDYSRIEDVVFVDPDQLLLSIVHQKDYQVIDQMINWNKVKDVYLVNLKSDNSQFLGTIEDLSETDIHFTNHHFIIHKDNRYKIVIFNSLV